MRSAVFLQEWFKSQDPLAPSSLLVQVVVRRQDFGHFQGKKCYLSWLVTVSTNSGCSLLTDAHLLVAFMARYSVVFAALAICFIAPFWSMYSNITLRDGPGSFHILMGTCQSGPCLMSITIWIKKYSKPQLPNHDDLSLRLGRIFPSPWLTSHLQGRARSSDSVHQINHEYDLKPSVVLLSRNLYRGHWSNNARCRSRSCFDGVVLVRRTALSVLLLLWLLLLCVGASSSLNLSSYEYGLRCRRMIVYSLEWALSRFDGNTAQNQSPGKTKVQRAKSVHEAEASVSTVDSGRIRQLVGCPVFIQ